MTIVVANEDKGNVTLMITRAHYEQLPLNILNDQTYYNKQARDPTTTIEQKGNKMLNELRNNNCIFLEQ